MADYSIIKCQQFQIEFPGFVIGLNVISSPSVLFVDKQKGSGYRHVK